MTAQTLPEALAIESAPYEAQDKRSGAAKKRDAERGVRFGCHVDQLPGEARHGCVIDQHRWDDCVRGRRHREKWTCPWWTPLNQRTDGGRSRPRADGWSAGYEAGARAAAALLVRYIHECIDESEPRGPDDTLWSLPYKCEDEIRRLDLPEAPYG